MVVCGAPLSAVLTYLTRVAERQSDGEAIASLLLDIGLPEMSGYEVCRRIRSEPWGAAITIVALTGWGQPADLEESGTAGFDAHLVKPVAPAALTALLDE